MQLFFWVQWRETDDKMFKDYYQTEKIVGPWKTKWKYAFLVLVRNFFFFSNPVKKMANFRANFEYMSKKSGPKF